MSSTESRERDDGSEPKRIESVGVLLGRVMWVVLGPVLLFGSAIGIFTTRGGWFTFWDAIFALVVAAMLAGRWVEHDSGAAITVTGEPATERQFRRYLGLLPAVSVGIWVLANVLGNHVFV